MYQLISTLDDSLIFESDCLLKARRKQKFGEHNKIVRTSDGTVLSEKGAADNGSAIVVRIPNLKRPIILI